MNCIQEPTTPSSAHFSISEASSTTPGKDWEHGVDSLSVVKVDHPQLRQHDQCAYHPLRQSGPVSTVHSMSYYLLLRRSLPTPPGDWPALLDLDLTAFALSLAELTTVVSAAPNVTCLKLCPAPACSAVGIPIISSDSIAWSCASWGWCAETERERGMWTSCWALNAHPPSSASLLPRLERFRMVLLDDAAVHLMLHRLRTSAAMGRGHRSTQ